MEISCAGSLAERSAEIAAPDGSNWIFYLHRLQSAGSGGIFIVFFQKKNNPFILDLVN
jgi:hypothetical protein